MKYTKITEQINDDICLYHWTDIQTPNFRIKPTVRMYLLGEKIDLTALIKGEPRKTGEQQVRTFLFDKDYCYEFFKRNIFESIDSLTPKQFLMMLFKFYARYKMLNKEKNTGYFLDDPSLKIYKLHGKSVIHIDDFLDEIYQDGFND